jgi:hypothetical protein
LSPPSHRLGTLVVSPATNGTGLVDTRALHLASFTGLLSAVVLQWLIGLSK